VNHHFLSRQNSHIDLRSTPGERENRQQKSTQMASSRVLRSLPGILSGQLQMIYHTPSFNAATQPGHG
jgi:hypothetical protein